MQIFQTTEANFRGVNLGDELQIAKSLTAPIQPKFQDRYGLSFEYELSPAGRLSVDYYSDNLITGMETNRIASIVAHVILDQEVETARLYQEIRAYFNEKYNLASGSYGDYVWSSATNDFGIMEVRLRLNDSKRGIVINFVDVQAGTKNEPASSEDI